MVCFDVDLQIKTQSIWISAIGKSKCNIFNLIIQFFVIIALLIIVTLSSIEFATSVGISDACDQPGNIIVDGLKKYTNIEQQYISSLEYYVFCDAKHNDSYILQLIDDVRNDTINNGQKYIAQAQAYVNSQETRYNVTYSKKVCLRRRFNFVFFMFDSSSKFYVYTF